MRLLPWPRSLAGQLMLVTALTLLIAQVINLVLLAGAQRNQMVVGTAAAAAAQFGDVVERVESGQPLPERMFLLRRERAEREGGRQAAGRDAPRRGPRRARRLVVADRPLFAPGMRPWPEVADQVSRTLGSNSGVGQVLAMRGAAGASERGFGARQRRGRGAEDPHELIAVAARLDDGRWVTARTVRPVAAQRIGTLLIGQTLILFGLLLGPLLFVAWRVSRPLSRLVAAAQAVRPGANVDLLPESGPRDVQELTRAFNAMRTRILAMLQDKDRMLGAIGHDLRTPLASLRVRVEQVHDVALRDKMVATVDDMAAMLTNILALARAGQPQDLPEQTDLAALLSGLVDDYRAMGKAATLAGDGAVVHVMVRASALRSAIRNLIDNALAYAGSARVGLELTGDGRAAVIVDDEGPGIAEDRIAAMLEPFARAEESRNRATGGAGLGLALARAVVQGEGGELLISNRLPRGLSARIILPL